MTATVIIVTLNRPDCVRQCLDCLRMQDAQPQQVILVDASADERTAIVAREFPAVQYVRTDVGYGHMTKSRNLGLARATGDVVVFVDDDAFAHEGWLTALLLPYADPLVGGVGGRALNNQPGEATRGVEQIGRLLPNGSITGFFAADPGHPIEVDHLVGCNMSWRRSILARLGGMRDDYPGTEVREETDLAFRVRALGYRLVFQPQAVVTHVGAAQAVGRRFDARYAYYHSRNHALLIIRNFGLFSPRAYRNVIREIYEMTVEAAKRIAIAVGHLAARAAGLIVGTVVGVWRFAIERGKPARRPPIEIGSVVES